MLRDLFSLFPAYAGVIPQASESLTPRTTFPRIRGGDPKYWVQESMPICFSPHMRG